MTKERIIIFTRNPELGKVKSRLAQTVGDHAALEIYKFLVAHTRKITCDLAVDKVVYYSEYIAENDQWGPKRYTKALQVGSDLGMCMKNAFKDSFEKGYEKVVIIGSDIYDLGQQDIEEAFKQLDSNDYVIGPAQDGGYYLLGMKSLNTEVFKNINWGTDTVFSNTLRILEGNAVHQLDERNDVDYYEDIKDNKVFQPFLKNINAIS